MALRRPRLRSAAYVALFGVCVGVASLPSIGTGATSGTVIGATVPSAIQLGNQCGARDATHFGSVLPGSPARTAGGASVCRYSFSSTNASSMLRLHQSDRAGSAMVGPPASWSVLTPASGNSYGVGAGTTAIVMTNWWDVTGQFWRSLDDGQNWTSYTTGDAAQGAVSLVGATVAWRGGAAITRSNDINAVGAPTWTNVLMVKVGGGSTATPMDIDAIDYGTAWFNGGQYAYRTTTPGAAQPWSEMWSNCVNSQNIEATSASTAFIPGNGKICRSTDSNASWVDLTTGVPAATYFNDVAAVTATPTTLWAVGNDGAVIRTADNGATWSSLPSVPVPTHLIRVHALSATSAVVGGLDGLFWYTADSGTNWTQLRPPTTGRPTGLIATSATTFALSSAGNSTWVTRNGGIGWTNVTPGADNSNDLDAYDDRTFAVATANGQVLVTTDAGSTFATRSTGLAPDNVRGIAMLDELRYIAVGSRGSIAVTQDAGVTWTRRVSGTTEDLWDVDVSPSGTAIAVGANGTILRSADNGWNWSVRSAAGPHLRRVEIRSSGVAIAGGFGGALRRSTDDGLAWAAPASGVTTTIRSISFPSDNVVYAAVAGTLIKSTDAGATWTSRSIGGMGVVGAASEDVVWLTPGILDGWQQWANISTDGGQTWTAPFSNHDPNANHILPLDGGRVLFAGEAQRVLRTAATTSIPDYGANTWATGQMFGACLQDLGGSAAVAAWAEDIGGATPNSCQALDTDPWNAVPTAPVKVAQMAAPGSGYADIVWGFKPASGQVAATYTAGITVEALAPNV